MRMPMPRRAPCCSSSGMYLQTQQLTDSDPCQPWQLVSTSKAVEYLTGQLHITPMCTKHWQHSARDSQPRLNGDDMARLQLPESSEWCSTTDDDQRSMQPKEMLHALTVNACIRKGRLPVMRHQGRVVSIKTKVVPNTVPICGEGRHVVGYVRRALHTKLASVLDSHHLHKYPGGVCCLPAAGVCPSTTHRSSCTDVLKSHPHLPHGRHAASAAPH
jgi:hypothetical protein